MNLLASDLDHVLLHTAGLWEELRGGRVFITGGTGFFGCWLLESLLRANEQLGLAAKAVVLTRQPNAFAMRAPHLAEHSAVRLHAGDMVDFSFPDGVFSHVIHAASEPSLAQPADALGLFENSLLGTRRVLEFARACGARKLLLTSSGAVYGPVVPGRRSLREGDGTSAFPLEPRWAYAEAKRAVEMLCALYSRRHGFEVKIARGFAFLGPYLPLEGQFAAGNFVRDALAGGPIAVQGSGTAVRSYLYGADLAVWLWTILFRGTPGRPYNVGSDQALSVAALARKVADECSSRVPVLVLSQPKPGEVVDYYVPDVSRAREELTLEVRVSLKEAIQRTIRWYRALGGLF